MSNIIKEIEAEQLKETVDQFEVGDTVKVYGKIKEGNRERIQVFEGVVLKRQGGSNRETFTVRKTSNGIGVEKTWPLHSPNVEKIEVVRKGKVRRAKLNYLRDRVGKPETPYKPGYTFDGWYTEKEGETVLWYFQSEKVTGDMTLTAHWVPAQFTVKFDYDGGTGADGSTVESKQVTFGETYGELPTPVKEGSTFGGWEYSGQIITADTVVQMTGEHVLTATWN